MHCDRTRLCRACRPYGGDSTDQSLSPVHTPFSRLPCFRCGLSRKSGRLVVYPIDSRFDLLRALLRRTAFKFAGFSLNHSHFLEGLLKCQHISCNRSRQDGFIRLLLEMVEINHRCRLLVCKIIGCINLGQIGSHRHLYLEILGFC